MVAHSKAISKAAHRDDTAPEMVPLAKNNNPSELIQIERTRCAACPLRRNPMFRVVTAAELSFISGMKIGELCIEQGKTVFTDGDASKYVFTVLSGWLFRYKTLPCPSSNALRQFAA